MEEAAPEMVELVELDMTGNDLRSFVPEKTKLKQQIKVGGKKNVTDQREAERRVWVRET